MDSKQMWGFPQTQTQPGFGMGMQPYQSAKAILPGRVITSMQEMRPQDVPMDGSPAVFPTNDGQYVYLKFWDQDCNCQTIRYVRDNSTIQKQEKPKDPMQLIMERLDEIEKRISISEQQSGGGTQSSSSAEQYYGTKEAN